MSFLLNLSNRWEQLALAILLVLAAGTIVMKAPGAMAKAYAAFSGAEHLLQDADTYGREVRPIPLLG
jgi:hypothetical protein